MAVVAADADRPCTCGRCRSCGIRRAHRAGKFRDVGRKLHLAWASGRFDGRKRGERANTWTDEENDYLRRHVGTCPFREVVAGMVAETGIERTVEAADVQVRALGLSRWVRCWQREHLRRLFRVAHSTVEAWIAEGLLAASRWRGRGGYPQWWIEDADLRRFITNDPWAYDWRRMKPGPMRSLAEVAAKANPYFTLQEVARLTGIPYWKLVEWARAGRLPAKRRTGRTGYVVSASSVADLRNARPGARVGE